LWAVIYKQNGEFIGHCGLQYLENTPEVELVQQGGNNYPVKKG
jgi:hypothetical protein